MTNFEGTRGSLDTLEFIRPNAEYASIIFHGFGADASDLFPLHEILSPSERMSWIFPQAPLEVSLGGGARGRAWFPLDVEALNRRIMSGRPLEESYENPKGLLDTRSAIDHLIEDVSENLKIPRKNILLGGFSQGAMVATDTVLRSQTPFAGLVIFSGAIVNESEWKAWAPKHAGTPFFQSHGAKDAILSVVMAKRLSLILQNGGMKGQLQSFSGGHEIPMEILSLAASFVSKKVLGLSISN